MRVKQLGEGKLENGSRALTRGKGEELETGALDGKDAMEYDSLTQHAQGLSLKARGRTEFLRRRDPARLGGRSGRASMNAGLSWYGRARSSSPVGPCAKPAKRFRRPSLPRRGRALEMELAGHQGDLGRAARVGQQADIKILKAERAHLFARGVVLWYRSRIG